MTDLIPMEVDYTSAALEECRPPSSDSEDYSEISNSSSDDEMEEELCGEENHINDGTDRPIRENGENSTTSEAVPVPNRRKRKIGKNGKVMKKKRNSKPSYQRRNIRNIMKETQLDTETLNAQQEELERKKRLNELKARLYSHMTGTGAANTSTTTETASQLKSLLQSGKKDEVTEENNKEEQSNKGLIEICSSDDDDECIVIDNNDDEEDNEVDDDPENSGCHVNDKINQPDPQGRVLVNVGHPDGDPDIFLAPQIARIVKPHQIGGVRYMFDNLIESPERYKSSPGFGCILAHSMGLGKTIQVVSFIDIFLRHTEAKTVLCIVPINTLHNWVAEFNMWCPPADRVMPGSDVVPRAFNLFVLNDIHKNVTARANVIDQWFHTGGVLLMGYEMYRLLASRKTNIRKPKKNSNRPMVIDLEQEDRDKYLKLDMQTALLRPGPDLIVCDEGHRIKNSLTGISQALKNIRTKRRVVLTGYPLQNNLIEYWCMVDFVRPNFLGSRTEFCNMFERPIMNGQCVDSTPRDMRIMRFRAHVLHSLLEGFVQRRSHLILKYSLPPKQEHVILVKMSPIQRELYNAFMKMLEENKLSTFVSTNPLKAFSVCCKIWNHPDILKKTADKKANDDDLDLDEGERSNGKKGRSQTKNSPVPPYMQTEGFMPFVDGRSQTITYEWAESILEKYSMGLLENGGKMVLLNGIIEESLKLGDKVLVFSQSLFTLGLIEEFLSKQKVPIAGMDEYWAKNKTYLRLDGSTASMEREKLINTFNSPSNTKCNVFLISTRAGCLGINLVGANRVIMMDASWNPCHDCQAICRVYRYGQVKDSFVYRFVTDNTLEKKIYERQVNKQGMADRVVDELQPQNNFTRKQVEKLMDYEDMDIEGLENNRDWSQVYTDSVLVKTLSSHAQWISKEPFKHESLLIHQTGHRLTKAEKRLAKQSYESEKKLNISYSRTSYSSYHAKPQPAVSNSASSTPRNLVQAQTSNAMPAYPPSQMTPVPQVPGLAATQGTVMKSLERPGVSVTKIVATTDILIPGTNTITESERPRIKAGSTILIIRTPKGVYVRTEEGKLFSVRSGEKDLQGSVIPGGESQNSTMTTTSTITPSSTSLSDSATTSTGTNKGPLAMLSSMLQNAGQTHQQPNIPHQPQPQPQPPPYTNPYMANGSTFNNMTYMNSMPYTNGPYSNFTTRQPYFPLSHASFGSQDEPLILSDSDQEQPSTSSLSKSCSETSIQSGININQGVPSTSSQQLPDFGMLNPKLRADVGPQMTLPKENMSNNVRSFENYACAEENPIGASTLESFMGTLDRENTLFSDAHGVDSFQGGGNVSSAFQRLPNTFQASTSTLQGSANTSLSTTNTLPVSTNTLPWMQSRNTSLISDKTIKSVPNSTSSIFSTSYDRLDTPILPNYMYPYSTFGQGNMDSKISY